jgi:hypothetical protein
LAGAGFLAAAFFGAGVAALATSGAETGAGATGASVIVTTDGVSTLYDAASTGAASVLLPNSFFNNPNIVKISLTFIYTSV